MNGISDKTAPSMKSLKKTYEIAGKKFTFETGKLVLLANGAVTIGDENGNMLLTTCGIKEEGLNKEADFFPLSVEYQEKYYATGKIGGNRFQKREGKPSDQAVIKARIIDRPIRPMFPKGLINEVQIISTVLSSSNDSDFSFNGITGASLALLMTNISFEGPVAGVKVALNEDGKFTFNPNFEDEEKSRLVLVVAGTSDALTMVEAEAKEVSDDEMMAGLEFAHEIIKQICKAEEDFISEYSKTFGIYEIKEYFNKPDETLLENIKEFLTEDKLEILYGTGKHEFQEKLSELTEQSKDYLVENKLVEMPEDVELEEFKESMNFVGELVYKRVKEVMRKNVLEKEKRLDGRKLNEVRQVICEDKLLPRAHGSAIFQRGLTQILSVTTLGGPDDVQIIDDMFDEEQKRYIHHYNFPPYAVGEVKPLRGVGRREIGHGRLAEKALEAVLPSEEDFPYMIRVVSETMTCNGSSSMASICGSTLSLMSAGVPIKAPVAGVAMGMIYDEESGKYKILSDIQAQEDFLGDMDFKVGRTPNGITAMQLDVKIKGLSFQVFRDAFSQGKIAIEYILGEMLKAVPEVAKELSPYAPRIYIENIPVDKIREVIGKGGENIQNAESEFGVSIHIEDDGKTFITSKDASGAQKAIEWLRSQVWVPEVGYKGKGKVTKIIAGTGALVEFEGKIGMIHISKLAPQRVNKVEDIVKVGDEVEFEIIQVDLEKGKIGLKKMF